MAYGPMVTRSSNIFDEYVGESGLGKEHQVRGLKSSAMSLAVELSKRRDPCKIARGSHQRPCESKENYEKKGHGNIMKHGRFSIEIG